MEKKFWKKNAFSFFSQKISFIYWLTHLNHILDLLNISYIYMGLTSTEIKTAIWVSFIGIGRVLPQQKLSTMAVLSEGKARVEQIYQAWSFKKF